MTTASADSYMQAMAQSFKPQSAGGLRVTYHLNLSGSGGGDWTISIDNGRCTIKSGRPATSDTSISMSTANYLKLAAGNLDVKAAVKKGDIKVGGNTQHALAFPNLFSPWANLANNPPTAPAPPVAKPVSPAPATTTAPPVVSTTPPAQPAPKPAPAPAAPASVAVYPQLMNGSFDEFQPYIYENETKKWNEFPEQVGKYWTLQVTSKVRARVMDSETFGKFTQKYFGGGGHDYHIHGKHSQVLTGRYRFNVVMHQTVAAKPGQSYTFSGSIVSFYKGTAGERKDGAIIKTIGVDPTGGQNWQSSTVVWGEKDGKDNEWRYPSLKVQAQAESMTVFIHIDNKEEDVGITELNIIHLENFKLE